MNNKIPRIMISATGSNAGKTTITTAVLKAFSLKNKSVIAYKTGPDYIDPMFHKKVIKIPSRNLDMFMLGENNCKYIISKNSKDKNISIIEGVMGYYDGIGVGTASSSYELSKALSCPTILVVNPKGMGVSACAIIEGFKNFRENTNIKGIILNNVSPKMYDYYKKMIEQNNNLHVYGYMPVMEKCRLENRHLGLITADEINNLEGIVNELGGKALETIDLDGLVELANKAKSIECKAPNINFIDKTRIAIAKDKAFCFYYEDSLNVLEALGAELVEFSPLKSKKLPNDIGGLYIGGGYPELYMEELSSNKELLADIKAKVSSGLPTFAECGGYMYLLHSFRAEDKEYKLVGAVEGSSFMTSSLKRFGYISLVSQNDNLMCSKGQVINGHEFHYSDSTNCGDSFVAKKPESNRYWNAIIADDTKFIGYPHINFLGNISFAQNFVKKSIEYQRGNK